MEVAAVEAEDAEASALPEAADAEDAEAEALDAEAVAEASALASASSAAILAVTASDANDLAVFVSAAVPVRNAPPSAASFTKFDASCGVYSIAIFNSP